MKKTKKERQRMSYETYAYLSSLIGKQAGALEMEFHVACDYVSQEPDGVTKAHKIFLERQAKLTNVQNELHAACAETYRDHPNPEMREFWGIK